MSADENVAGKEFGADRSEGDKKGRFTVKFALGRLDSEGSEIASPGTPRKEPSFPSGEL